MTLDSSWEFWRRLRGVGPPLKILRAPRSADRYLPKNPENLLFCEVRQVLRSPLGLQPLEGVGERRREVDYSALAASVGRLHGIPIPLHACPCFTCTFHRTQHSSKKASRWGEAEDAAKMRPEVK